MTAIFHEDLHVAQRSPNGEGPWNWILDHKSEIGTAICVTTAILGARNASRAANNGENKKALAWGLYSGVQTLGAVLNAGSAIVECRGDDSGNHPVVRARNILYPLSKPQEKVNPVQDMLDALEGLTQSR